MHEFQIEMDANSLADKIVALVTESGLLTPMIEVRKGDLPDVVDMSVPQIVRESVIKLTHKHWERFLIKFGGNEKTLRKRIDENYLMVKTDKEFENKRFEHCYVKDWEEAGRNGTPWVTTSIVGHQDCQLYEACLFIAVKRTWTLWHVDFDPASPSVTTLVCGWKLWLICTQTELARELCRDGGRLEDLLKLLEAGGSRLKHVHWAIQRPGDSVILPWGLAHCVLTMSDKVNSTTTAMLSYVVNGSEEERMEREAWVNQRFASNFRKGSMHGN